VRVIPGASFSLMHWPAVMETHDCSFLPVLPQGP